MNTQLASSDIDEAWLDGKLTGKLPSELEIKFYYSVHWQERADHESALVRKQPICGHLRQEIWKA